MHPQSSVGYMGRLTDCRAAGDVRDAAVGVIARDRPWLLLIEFRHYFILLIDVNVVNKCTS